MEQKETGESVLPSAISLSKQMKQPEQGQPTCKPETPSESPTLETRTLILELLLVASQDVQEIETGSGAGAQTQMF